MKTIYKTLICLYFVGFVFSSGCKKDIEVEVKNPVTVPDNPQIDTMEAKDYQTVLSILTQVLNFKCQLEDLSPTDFFEIHTSSGNPTGIKKDTSFQQISSNYDTIRVSIDYDENAQIVTSRSLAYIFSGIPDAEGRIKEGKIIYKINSDKFFLDSGMTCDISFENFKIDNNEVNGMVIVENKGDDSYSITTQNFTGTIQGKTVEITDGAFTKIDDLCSYKLTGNASVTSSMGIAFIATITDTVTVNTQCKWRLVEGNIELAIPNESTQSVNFGNGACDPFASVTINGVTVPIILI